MLSVAIIDIIGLTYDGTTLSKRGLGGSESAVILMAKELANIGFNVTVFNNCIDKEASPGTYDNVKYIDISTLDTNKNYNFDITISSRTVVPFLPKELYNQFSKYNPERFHNIISNSQFRVLWMHDTFCLGDHLVENLTTSGFINEIFTLSDFHTNYITSCDHGSGRRMFEVLKDKIFQTRNGINKYQVDYNIKDKDPYLCVYNASVTKGMLPLVNYIWPIIKQHVPKAKLKVIGGYYRFRENAEPDAQEKTWRALVADKKYSDLDIEFTGIITQKEIAEIFIKSSLTLHPGAFPETFGISSLESLNYNTPLVTCKFGALEETAADSCSYLLNYPVEPNGMYPNINAKQQQEQYAKLAIIALKDKYLWQQKANACNAVKEVSTWDTVALQWKQHFYKIFGVFISKEEFRKVSYINYRIKKVFGRRFVNTEDLLVPSFSPESKILVVTPTYNSNEYIARTIESVVSQDYDNWSMTIINDCSTDTTLDIISSYANKFPNINVVNNSVNKGAVYNQINTIKEQAAPEDIVMLLDGDDSLVPDNQIFRFYNEMYNREKVEFTYGSCWSMVDRIPLVAQEYPTEIKETKNYRNYLFNWNMPYTHLRTFKAKLILNADESNFKDSDGNWYKAGGDCSVFYTALENADPSKVKAVTDIVYNYNDLNPLNDYKINGEEQTKNAKEILRQKEKQNTENLLSKKEKFSVIIPTMWKCDTFVEFLRKLNSIELVGEIIVINNDVNNTTNIDYKLEKVTVYDMSENIFVNPAWNLGVSLSTNNKLCIVNDDVEFDTNLFDKIYEYVTAENGVSGLCPGEVENFKQIPVTDKTIDIVEWKQGMHTFGFGSLMFIHKDNWENIPTGLNVYFGDNFIFDRLLKLGKTNFLIANMNFNTKWAQTTSDKTIVPSDTLEKENTIYMQYLQSLEKPKNILIAIPTNLGIKPDTFKAIFDLKVPTGYKTHFQYFYGYQIDQIRNLIAEWGKRYDYLFCVDSDISFKPDTLEKLLSHNKDIVAGIYIQRKPGLHIIEAYDKNGNIPYENLVGRNLVEVDAVGFGCILINSKVLREMEYPHFVYKSAIDHRYTLSEDVYFCRKAASLGFKTYVDPAIVCDHHGDTVYKVNTNIMPNNTTVQPTIDYTNRLIELGKQDLLPQPMVNYLNKLKDENPKVIYDIGSCVLHWTNKAKQVWPESTFVLFEAMEDVKPLYDAAKYPYHLGVLSNEDGKEVSFYQNTFHPGGNSYYLENEKVNPEAPIYFNEGNKIKKSTRTLDSVVKENNFPYPDLIKIDVQGAELDILKGANEVLNHTKHLILELQHTEYNKGAPAAAEVISYLESKNFRLVCNIHKTRYDGDYHFVKIT